MNHFHERWQAEHGGTRSYTWTKNRLQRAGYVVRAPRRGAHRKKRLRKPLPGMMLHQDGSPHEWVPGCQWDLIVTMDDATSELYSAFFVEDEGTMSSFQGLREVIEARGLVSSLYRSRNALLVYRGSRSKVDKIRLTQVHRALQQLGITDMAAANRYLREQFLPAHNRRFATPAAEVGTAFVPWIGTNLVDVLCIQEERVVAHDNTVRYQGRSLQIPPDPHRFHYVKTTVRVHEYPDGTLAVFHGPRCLAHYDAAGQLIELKAESGRQKDTTVRSRARPIVAPGASVGKRFSARS